MNIAIDTSSISDYRTFLKAKALPQYRIEGGFISIPDEFASLMGTQSQTALADKPYQPHPKMFDYQAGLAKLAVKKKKYAIFADCGLGKTLILLDWSIHVASVLPAWKKVLILCPLMVVKQTVAEAKRFYGKTVSIASIASGGLAEWLSNGTERIGVTNYEALNDQIGSRHIGAMVLDESSILKSHYGEYGQQCIRIGDGLDWKLCLTGTPAPNDRIEYATHAVFLDQFPTVNSFLARFFVNRGETQERWELKPHAIRPFYRQLASWSVCLVRPAAYGYKDNTKPLPPIHCHIHDVPLTNEQHAAVMDTTKALFVTAPGGIVSRNMLSRLAKGRLKSGESISSNKPAFIASLINSWPDESTIIWCLYNDEQDALAKQFPDAVNIDGSTPYADRLAGIDRFKAGQSKILISKPKVLGYGLNLQIATRQIFSGLQDSYEQFYQAVKRSNRYGSTRPLNVHIPVTSIERPMVENVLDKAKRIDADTIAQEEEFIRASII